MTDNSHPSHVGVEYETELNKKRQRRAAPPLIGKTFGGLTVLPTEPKRDRYGKWWFEVQCACGERRMKRAEYITGNHSCRTCYLNSVRRRPHHE
jgi:hypothetical protein